MAELTIEEKKKLKKKRQAALSEKGSQAMSSIQRQFGAKTSFLDKIVNRFGKKKKAANENN